MNVRDIQRAVWILGETGAAACKKRGGRRARWIKRMLDMSPDRIDRMSFEQMTAVWMKGIGYEAQTPNRLVWAQLGD